jgi:tRNA(Ile)-lysidine synthase
VDRPAAPDAVTAAELFAAVARLIGSEAAERDRFGIAVSGGADSLALLLLAREAFPGRIAAATVDHGLRPESADEAALVARHCAALGVPHAILRPSTPISGSVQASARAARYALLDQWREAAGIDWLMTAHHADDQLETIAMRLNRGSGVAGLAGVRAMQGRVLRPLLHIRHQALLARVIAAGIAWVDDPSNTDARFDRARMRLALAQSPIDPIAAAHSADHLADADAALDWAADRLAAERLTAQADAILLDTADLPAELLRRLALRAIRRLAGPDEADPRGESLTLAIARLNAGQAASLGALLLVPERRAAHLWRISAAPPRRTG